MWRQKESGALCVRDTLLSFGRIGLVAVRQDLFLLMDGFSAADSVAGATAAGMQLPRSLIG